MHSWGLAKLLQAYLVDSWQGHNSLEVASAMLKAWVHIAAEQCGQQWAVLNSLQQQEGYTMLQHQVCTICTRVIQPDF